MSLKADRERLDYYPYLPQWCKHGIDDPHRCSACHRYAAYRAREARQGYAAYRAREARQAAAQQQTALFTATDADASDRELQEFQDFLAHRYPALDEVARALAFGRDHAAHQVWKTIRDAARSTL